MDDETFLAALARVAPELLVYAAKLVAQARELDRGLADLVERRANDAKRKRRWYWKNKAENLTLPSREVDPSIEFSSTSTQETVERERNLTLPSREVRARSRAKLHPLPDDWAPKDMQPSEALELEKMKDWARANGTLKADWDATWRNWRRRAPEFKGRSNGNGRAGSVLAAGERIDAELKARGATDNYVPGSSGPRPLGVDQPPRTNGIRSLPKG